MDMFIFWVLKLFESSLKIKANKYYLFLYANTLHMDIIIESDRLFFREFNLLDVNPLYKLNQNPNVLTYTGDQPYKNKKEVENFIKNYNQYSEYKMGRWSACNKKHGKFVGWCGLKYHPNEDIVEVGYRFYEEEWNKGYATEACKAAVKYGFNTLRIQKIYAFSHVDNTRSIRVLEKCGFKRIETIIRDGDPVYKFCINNDCIYVKEISAEETYSVRHEVLRQGKPIETCKFDGDSVDTTFHLGLFYYGKLVGVVSYMNVSNTQFTQYNQYQLRGMAISTPFQGKQLGNVLLKEGERKLKHKNIELVWCNAREVAVNFYKRFDFSTIGESFDIPTIGKHFVMFKLI